MEVKVYSPCDEAPASVPPIRLALRNNDDGTVTLYCARKSGNPRNNSNILSVGVDGRIHMGRDVSPLLGFKLKESAGNRVKIRNL